MSAAPVRVSLGGARVDLVDRAGLLDTVGDRLLAPRQVPLYVVSANLDHIHHFGSGASGALPTPTAAGAEWLVVLDGMPLVWTARRLTRLAWEQLAGSDLLPELLQRADTLHARLGVLGGSPAMHAALRPLLAERYPGIEVAGLWSPGRAEVDDAQGALRLADEVRRAGVDLLVVGLGKPRQEEWLAGAGAASGAKVALAFGASFDFLTGTVRRAPARWSRLGLEWLHRLLSEPRRLYRRYLLHGPRDVATLLRASHLGP